MPPGLLAQVVPDLTNDLKLRGSSPCINTYPAKKKKYIYIYIYLNDFLLPSFQCHPFILPFEL